MYFRGFFRFCMRYLTPFAFLPKGGRLPLELKQKGSNLSKQCKTSDSDYSYIRQIFTCNFICEISQRIMFHWLEKLLVQIRAPAANCLRNPQFACSADNVGNIPLGEINLNFKKWRQVLKFCLPSAVIIPMRACSTIPLSGRSNLVRRYL